MTWLGAALLGRSKGVCVVLNDGLTVVRSKLVVRAVDVIVVEGLVLDGALSILVVHGEAMDLMRVKQVMGLLGIAIFVMPLNSPLVRVVVVITGHTMVTKVLGTVVG